MPPFSASTLTGDTCLQEREKKMRKGTKKSDQLWVVGKMYFIRTVTMYYVGELVSVDDHEVVLRDAAWVADTGRFNEALRTGNISECEPFPDGLCGVGRGAIVDASIWAHGPLRKV